MSGYTTAEALAAIAAKGDAVTLDDIRSIVGGTDAGSGAEKTTVLYSGVYVDDRHSRDAAEFLASQSDSIRIIDDTPVGTLLADNSNGVRRAITKALNNADPSLGLTKLRSVLVNNVLFGGGTTTKAQSLWGIASANFVAAAEGDLITLTPNAAAGRIYSDVELDVVMANDNIETINGMKKADIIEQAGGDTTEAIRGVIDRRAATLLNDIEFVGPAAGETRDDLMKRLDIDKVSGKMARTSLQAPGKEEENLVRAYVEKRKVYEAASKDIMRHLGKHEEQQRNQDRIADLREQAGRLDDLAARIADAPERWRSPLEAADLTLEDLQKHRTENYRRDIERDRTQSQQQTRDRGMSM